MQFKDFEIIDFHTHPFSGEKNNICAHSAYCGMSPEQTIETMDKLGVSKICGSVLTLGVKRSEGVTEWALDYPAISPRAQAPTAFRRFIRWLL